MLCMSLCAEADGLGSGTGRALVLLRVQCWPWSESLTGLRLWFSHLNAEASDTYLPPMGGLSQNEHAANLRIILKI